MSAGAQEVPFCRGEKVGLKADGDAPAMVAGNGAVGCGMSHRGIEDGHVEAAVGDHAGIHMFGLELQENFAVALTPFYGLVTEQRTEARGPADFREFTFKINLLWHWLGFPYRVSSSARRALRHAP